MLPAPNTEPSPKTRLTGIDAARGVAIAAVVLIHAAPTAAPEWNDVVVAGAARLAVPTFFLVSGYLHALRATPHSRLLSHAAVFAKLHVIWALIYAGVDLLNPEVTFSWSLRPMLLHFGAGAWAGQFFLPVFIQVMLVAAAVGSARRWATPLAAFTSIAAWTGGATLLAAWHYGWQLSMPLEIVARARGNPVWLWFVYFAAGGVVARVTPGYGLSVPWRRAVALIATLAGILLVVFDLPVSPGPTYVASFPYPRPSVLLGTLCLAAALPAIAASSAPRLLTGLGRRSFAIYVLNPALLVGATLVLGRPQGPAESVALAVLVLAVAWGLSGIIERRAPFLLP